MRPKKIHAYIIFMIITLPFCFSLAQNNINTSYKYSNHRITIYYDFQGDSEQQYNISVILKRTSNPNFNLVPGSVTGDFGEGKYADGKRKIIWNLSPQEEEILTGNDYYFAINAAEIKSGGIAWYVYVLGIGLGGGAAAVLLGKKNASAGSNSNSTTTFPTPPGRPSGD